MDINDIHNLTYLRGQNMTDLEKYLFLKKCQCNEVKCKAKDIKRVIKYIQLESEMAPMDIVANTFRGKSLDVVKGIFISNKSYFLDSEDFYFNMKLLDNLGRDYTVEKYAALFEEALKEFPKWKIC